MCVKKLPCIKYNKSKSSIEIFKGKHILLEVKISNLIDNGKIDLDRFFPKLEKLVVSEGLKDLRVSLNDNLFKFACVNQFKNTGNDKIQNISIAITPKIIRINNELEKQQILKRFHDDPILGGHPGTHRLLKKIKRSYTWKNLDKYVKNYVKNCEQCLKNKLYPKISYHFGF